MTGRLYEAAETLVYDPIVANRHATRASLHTLGFRNSDFPSTLEIFAGILKARSPDLLLFEVSGAEAEICQFMQAVRQGDIGQNPFVVIIATTWRCDGAIVNQIINSGADDLIARPFSTAVLAERIRLQIERRKGFVVTADYIGPDRRRDPTRSGANCFEVPNSLKLKTTSTLAADELERQISSEVIKAKESLNLEKIRRTAFQLCVQWRLLEQRRPGAEDFNAILSRIGGLSGEVKRRSLGTPHASVAEWCDSIGESIRTLGAVAARDSDARDSFAAMQLLGHAAMALGQMFAPSEVHPSHLVELDALVARIDASDAGGRPTPVPGERHRPLRQGNHAAAR